MSNCPESCEDVTPVCSENTPPPPSPAPPQAPETGCINDPSYYDAGWTCDDWIGYSCRTGAAGVNTALLVRSCPIACVDVTRICKPPTAPPPPPGPPANPLFNNWPPPPPPPETGKCIADGIGREGGAFGVGLSAVGLLMIALLFVLRRAAPIRWGGIPFVSGWMTYCVLLLPPAVIFLATTGLYAACYASPTVYYICLSLFPFDSLLFFVAAFGDPGFLPRGVNSDGIDDAILKETVNGISIDLKVCKTCKIIRPPRSSHDRKTDRCVRRFDHYCPWIGNAVGEGNYVWFLAFVTTTCFTCLLFIGICLWHISHLSMRLYADSDDGAGGLVAGEQLGSGTAFGKALAKGGLISLFLLCYLALVAFLTGALLSFHLRFISRGLTTYEWLKGTWKAYERNPFDGGTAANFMLICHPAEKRPAAPATSRSIAGADQVRIVEVKKTTLTQQHEVSLELKDVLPEAAASAGAAMNINKGETNKSIAGMLTAQNSGGCPNFKTWTKNPTVNLMRRPGSAARSTILVELEQTIPDGGGGARIGLLALKHSVNLQSANINLSKVIVGKTDFSRAAQHSLTLSLSAKDPGCVLMPMSFEPGETASVKISVRGEHGLTLTKGPNWHGLEA